MPTMGQVRMKIYAIFRSVILLSLVGAAQSAGADATPPDYEIVKLKKDSSGLFEVEARRSFTVFRACPAGIRLPPQPSQCHQLPMVRR
jgi:hypothetical protein